LPTPANTEPSSQSSSAKILVFDSGVGGLSILQEIRQQYPNCCYFYASDNAEFPYGTKDEEELIERVDAVLHKLYTLTQADIIVIACNTASTVALPRIRERFTIPIIGVVPAVKPAAKTTNTKVIGLLGTPGTVKRGYTQQLIDEFASDCEVIPVGSSELVTLAEKKLRGETVGKEQIEPIVTTLMAHSQLDTVILACTHFPLLKAELMNALPKVCYWVDSGEAIARRVGYWIEQLPAEKQCSAQDNIQNNSKGCIAYFTEEHPNIKSLDASLDTLAIRPCNSLAI